MDILRASVILFAFVITILGFCTSCSTPQSLPSITPSIVQGTTVSHLPLPTTSPNTGIVKGIIVNAETKKPLTNADGVIIFLAPVLRDPQNHYAIGELNRETAPHSDPDADGRFTVVNVPPGEYAIAVFTPINATAARNPDDLTKDISVIVLAGQTVDTGLIYGRYP